MILVVEGLRLELPRTRGRGRYEALSGFDLELCRGDSVALVGASASGKSLIALALLGLVPPGGRLSVRRFELAGVALDPACGAGWTRVRGRHIAHVPQEPRASLDPLRTVGAQLEEVFACHGREPRRILAERALLDAGFDDPERIARLHPHALSGGMAQRVALALALALDPDVLVADEPTTALDLELRAELLLRLEARVAAGAALVMVTHDLRVAARCRRVQVVQLGRVVESGPAGPVLLEPLHPHAQALLSDEEGPLAAQDLEDAPPGCASHRACLAASDRCRAMRPPLAPLRDRRIACHHPGALRRA